MKPWSKVAIAGLVGAGFSVFSLPMVLYEIGLSNIEGRPQRLTPSDNTDSDTRLLLQEFHSTGPLVIRPLNPWTFLLTLREELDHDPGERAIWTIVGNYNYQHLKSRRMTYWHLSGAALSIWVSRNWTQDEVVTAAAAILRAHRPQSHSIDPSKEGETATTGLSDTGAPKTPLQLRAAFRAAQRCVQERTTIRAKAWNPDYADPPPHIPGCDDMKGALRNVFEATLAAAKAGDLDAQLCYLAQGYGDRESGFRLTETELAEYQAIAPQYVDAAFQRGDWRIVELLAFDIVDWAGLFINLPQWKDPAREYKAHQLLLLGAADADPQDPDPWLGALHTPVPKEDWRLSADDMRAGDAWAQETFDKYFVSQPRLTKEPRVCSDQDAPS